MFLILLTLMLLFFLSLSTWYLYQKNRFVSDDIFPDTKEVIKLEIFNFINFAFLITLCAIIINTSMNCVDNYFKSALASKENTTEIISNYPIPYDSYVIEYDDYYMVSDKKILKQDSELVLMDELNFTKVSVKTITFKDNIRLITGDMYKINKYIIYCKKDKHKHYMDLQYFNKK